VAEGWGFPVKVSSILQPLPRDRPLRGIAVAAGVGLFGLAALARWELAGLAEGFGPMLLLPAILVAGLIGGIRVGLGVSVVCFLVAWTWFFPPYGTFILEPRYSVTIAAFILTAVLQLYIIRVLKLAINDLSLAEQRSATLFRELQHRVANNLQVVAGVLRKERKTLDRDHPAAFALEKALERLDLMVRVHRSLNSPTIVELPIGDYLQDLGEDLIRASNSPTVQLTVAADPIKLDVERLMSLSMIVAEAITNALKHAFQGRSDGTIAVHLSAEAGAYILTVRDDGPGILPTSRQAKSQGLGRGIIEGLVAQLRGKLSLEEGSGATVRVVFPI
jgi:two-component sensor histidine kinase